MSHLHLALALGGHRTGATAPWADLAAEAESGLLDLVTLDAPAGTPADAPDDELAAVRAATRLAASTRSIGLLPAVRAGLSEPGRLAGAVEELDRASGGRAGVLLQVPVPADEQGWVRAVRRRWSAGADGPVVALPGRPGRGPRALPSAAADLGFVVPRTTVEVHQLVAAARTEGAPRHLFGDLVVVLDDDADRARDRADLLAASAPTTVPTTAPTTAPEGTRVFAGTPSQLADLALAWRAAGLSGLRLHPAEPLRDLLATTRGLVPELQRRGAHRRSGSEPGLRERLLAETTRRAAGPERSPRSTSRAA